jgi:steroid delta-isomerase-like uncharacterized protein
VSTQLSEADLAARNKLIDEHVRAEVVHDLDAIMRTWGTANPWFEDVPFGEKWYGLDEIRKHYVELLAAFPDLAIQEHKRHVTDEFMILEVTVSGTHLGDWRGLPALGRRMESRVAGFYTFDDEGMLNLERTYYDNATIYDQLGIYQDPRRPLGKVMAVLTPPFTIVRTLVRRVLRRS